MASRVCNSEVCSIPWHTLHHWIPLRIFMIPQRLRRLLRVSWTARRSNQSILKEIKPEFSLEGLALRLKFQYFATLWKGPTYWQRPWCWERLRAGGEEGDRGWDGLMASLTQWTWVWVNSRSWWRTRKPGVLQSMGSQRVRRDLVTEQQEVFQKQESISLSLQAPAYSSNITEGVLFLSLLWSSQKAFRSLFLVHSPWEINTTLWCNCSFACLVPHLIQVPLWHHWMATDSSILAWRIPWMEEPGGLQSTGSLRVGHDWATSLWLLCCICLYIPRVSNRA